MLPVKIIPNISEHKIPYIVKQDGVQQDGVHHIAIELKMFLRRTFTEEQLMSHHYIKEGLSCSLDIIIPIDFLVVRLH